MLARLAPFLFVLLWSSSFITTKAGLRHLSPLLFVAIRLTACAVVLVASDAGAAPVVATACGLALAALRDRRCTFERRRADGAACRPDDRASRPGRAGAIADAATDGRPRRCVLLGEHLHGVQWLGLVLGMVGVGLVVGEAAFESPARFQGLVLAFVGVLGLVAGTLYFGRFCRGMPLLPGATAQFLSAAAVSALGAWLLETPRTEWTEVTVVALTWNTLLVSLGGMGLYSAMLVRGSVASTSANFYLIPGTTAVLAWLLLGEQPNLLAISGLLVATAGCWLVNTTPATVAAIDDEHQ
jgi:drug/metabolite transporter (DMT)-like permease